MPVKLKIFFTALSLSVFVWSYGQQPEIRNLVFEGAGMRGIAYSGAIRELEKNGQLKKVERVAGTSSGAITALLISLGYTADEITGIVYRTPFKKFNDGRFFLLGGINRFQKYFGWYRGRQFEKWLSGLIAAKTGDADISFAGLSKKGFRQLYVTGTCINKQMLVIFSHETYPDMKVKDAIRISMSIPLYFEAVFLNASGKIINHPRNKEGLDVMTDGGLTGNFPIRLFDSTRYMDTSFPNEYRVNPATIGFRIDRQEQVANDSAGKGLAAMDVYTLKDYLGAFYNIIVENLNRQMLTAADWQRTVSISDGDIRPRIRKLSQKELQTLISNGSAAYLKFAAK